MKSLICLLTILNASILMLEAQKTDFTVKQKTVQIQLANLLSLTDSLFDYQSDIINGRLDYPVSNTISHPYYSENIWSLGKIWYYGRPYDSVMLKYNICTDNLIWLVRKPANSFPLCLNREEIKEFMIGEHRFTYLNDFGKSDEAGMKPGYYEIAYEGKTRLIIRREKTEETNRFTLEKEYTPRLYFYLRFEGQYIKVANNNDFINSFPRNKQEVRDYMKKVNVRFSARNYEPIIKVLEFYDNQYFK